METMGGHPSSNHRALLTGCQLRRAPALWLAAVPARGSALSSLFGMVTDEQCDMPLLTRPSPHPPTRTRTNKASAKAKKRTRLWSLEFSMFKKRESGERTAKSLCEACYSSLAFLLSPPFSSAGAATSSSFRFPLSAGGCVLRGLKLMMMQVMLSQPVPSPEVSGAKH